jgi:hypothetical protein
MHDASKDISAHNSVLHSTIQNGRGMKLQNVVIQYYLLNLPITNSDQTLYTIDLNVFTRSYKTVNCVYAVMFTSQNNYLEFGVATVQELSFHKYTGTLEISVEMNFHLHQNLCLRLIFQLTMGRKDLYDGLLRTKETMS